MKSRYTVSVFTTGELSPDLACVAGPQFWRARGRIPARCKSGPHKIEGLPRRLLQIIHTWLSDCPGAVSKNATIVPLAEIEHHAQTLNICRHYQQRKLKARNW